MRRLTLLWSWSHLWSPLRLRKIRQRRRCLLKRPCSLPNRTPRQLTSRPLPHLPLPLKPPPPRNRKPRRCPPLKNRLPQRKRLLRPSPLPRTNAQSKINRPGSDRSGAIFLWGMPIPSPQKSSPRQCPAFATLKPVRENVPYPRCTPHPASTGRAPLPAPVRAGPY